MSDETKFKVVKLTKSNYVAWKWQFNNVLVASNLEKVLEDGEVPKAMNSKALALLGSCLNEDNINNVSDCKTFKEAWTAIQKCYEIKTAYEPQALYRELSTYKMNSASDVAKGVSDIKRILAQLKNLDEKVSDNFIIGTILSALPNSFNIFTMVWKNSSDTNVDSLITKLMAEATEQASKEQEEVKALNAKKNLKSTQGSSVSLNRVTKDQCRYCKETGHWIKDCPNLKTPYDPTRGKNKNKGNSSKDKNDKKDIDDGDSSELAFMTMKRERKLSRELWVADSGCTQHMSPYLELFSSFKEVSEVEQIQLADSTSDIKVLGCGDIRTKQGKLSNVLYAPGLGQNLFSISTAAENNVFHSSFPGKLVFYYKNRELFTANLANKLYLIKFDTEINQALGQANAATLKQWHARFNHVSPQTIKLMSKNNVVEGLKIVEVESSKCEDCQMNKCTRAQHPSRSTVKAAVTGNVLHIDTAGPSNIKSRSNSCYFVLCKDEASRYRQVAFVKTKDLIPNKVKEFISRTQLETGNNALKIMTDSGSEFVNKDLSQFLQNRGIIHDMSAVQTAQQNGLIERDIRTIKNAAKTMLNSSKLNKNLWPEAVNSAVYTSNRVINSGNSTATPYELWFGNKPNVMNLYQFGEVAILHKLKGQLDNSWDEKGKKAIFVGYTDRFNTFRFLVNNKIVESCDVVFTNKISSSENSPRGESEKDDEFWYSLNLDEGVQDEDERPLSPGGYETPASVPTSPEIVQPVAIRPAIPRQQPREMSQQESGAAALLQMWVAAPDHRSERSV